MGGYVGKTEDLFSRDSDHKLAFGKFVSIFIECSTSGLTEFIQYIIIKIMNAANFKINAINGKNLSSGLKLRTKQ